MSVTFRVYQIARDPGSGGTDTGQTLTTNVDNDKSSQFLKVSGLPGLPEPPAYLRVGNEIMEVSKGYRATGEAGRIEVTRGSLGSIIENHTTGDPVFTYGQNEIPNVAGMDIFKAKTLDDFEVEDLGELSETLEFESAEFEISNINATLSGVPRTALQDAGDIQKPWVFEVSKGGEVKFHGMIQQKGLKYNASTQLVEFDAVSWLEILDRAGEIPARAVWETEVIDTSIDKNEGTVTVTFVEPNDDGIVIGDPGDVVVIETGEREIRRQIIRSSSLPSTNDPDRTIRRVTFRSETADKVLTQGTNIVKYVYEGGIVPGPEFNEFDFIWRRKWTIDKGSQAWDDLFNYIGTTADNLGLGDIYDVQDTYPSELEEANVIGLIQKNDEVVAEIPLKAVYESTNVIFVNVLENRKEDGRPEDLKGLAEDENADVTFIKYQGGDVPQIKKLTFPSEGDKVRVLDQDVWGYPGETSNWFGNAIVDHYETETVIDNLMKVRDRQGKVPLLGVARDIYGSTTVQGSADIDDIGPLVEFPKKPIKALRAIQMKTKTLARVVNTLGPTGLPQFSIELIPREDFFTESAQAQDRILEWVEDVAPKTLDAVVVKTNEDYLQGENIPKPVGFWYPGLEEDEASGLNRSQGVPGGDDVIEVEVPMIPSLEFLDPPTNAAVSTNMPRNVWQGGDENVLNDPKLRELAKFYFKHFRKADRAVELATGRQDLDLLGQVIGVNEGSILDNNVLITSQKTDLAEEEIETRFEGRITGEASNLESSPRIIINGETRYGTTKTIDNTTVEDVTVSLSGVRSWDALPGSLSFTWDRRRAGQGSGDWEQVATGPRINDTIDETSTDANGNPLLNQSANDEWLSTTLEYRLTVTNTSSGSSEQKTESVFIGLDYPHTGFPTEVERTVQKSQVEKNGKRWGRALLQFSRPDLVKTVKYRLRHGGEITTDPNDNLIDGEGVIFGRSLTDPVAEETVSDFVDTSLTVGESKVVDYDGQGTPDNDDDVFAQIQADVLLHEKHISNIEFVIEYKDETQIPTEAIPISFDFDRVPAPSYDHDLIWNDTTEKWELVAIVFPDEDTESVKFEVIQGGNTYTFETEITGSPPYEYNLVQNTNLPGADPGAVVASDWTWTAYSEWDAGVAGIPQTEPFTLGANRLIIAPVFSGGGPGGGSGGLSNLEQLTLDDGTDAVVLRPTATNALDVVDTADSPATIQVGVVQADGEVAAFGGNGPGLNASGFAANDPIAIDTSVDPHELNFEQEIREGGTVQKTGATFLNFTGDATVVANGSGVDIEVTGGTSGGASTLSDLSDVDSAAQADGNVLASGGGAYRDEGIEPLVQDHVLVNSQTFQQDVYVQGNLGVKTTSPTKALEVAGEILASGEVAAFGGNGPGLAASGFAANAPISIDTSVDPHEINFEQDIRQGGSSVQVGPTHLNFTGDVNVTASGTGVDIDVTGGTGGASSLSQLSDVSSAVQADGNVLASGGGDYREESIAALAEAHIALVNLSDVDTTVSNAQLTNSSVTVAGNSVPLGGSTSVSHSDLSGIASDDHHTRYSDAEARSAVEGTTDVADLIGTLGTSGQVAQTDGTAVSWVTLSASDVSGVSADSVSDAHHSRPVAGSGLTESSGLFNVNVGNALEIASDAVAVASNSIGTSELSFNPATQAELDNHVADNDAHHTRPVAGSGLSEVSGTFNVNAGDGLSIFNGDVNVNSTVARTNTNETFGQDVYVQGSLGVQTTSPSQPFHVAAQSQFDAPTYLGAIAGGPEGTLGDGDGEMLRFGKGSDSNSDSVIHAQGGHGRIAWTWNAYYDQSVSQYRTIQDGSEVGATLIGMMDGSLGPGVSSPNITFAVTAIDVQTRADSTISEPWDTEVRITTSGLEVDGRVDASGEIEAFTSSDAALKRDLRAADRSLGDIAAHTFTWGEEAISSKQGRRDLGLIAQEVQEHIPEAVREDDRGYLMIEPTRILAVAIDEIQRLKDRINELEQRTI